MHREANASQQCAASATGIAPAAASSCGLGVCTSGFSFLVRVWPSLAAFARSMAWLESHPRADLFFFRCGTRVSYGNHVCLFRISWRPGAPKCSPTRGKQAAISFLLARPSPPCSGAHTLRGLALALRLSIKIRTVEKWSVFHSSALPYVTNLRDFRVFGYFYVCTPRGKHQASMRSLGSSGHRACCSVSTCVLDVCASRCSFVVRMWPVFAVFAHSMALLEMRPRADLLFFAVVIRVR